MDSRRTSRAAAVLVGAVAFSLAACTAPPAPDALPDEQMLDDLQPIVLTVADLDSGAGAGLLALEAWMAEVTARTNGKVTFDTFYGGSLIPATELVSGLSSGLADIGFISPSIAPDQLPVGGWHVTVDTALVPAGFPTGSFIGDLANAQRTHGPGPVRDELEALNLVPLSANMFVAPGPLLCESETISTLEEAAGVTVRVGGQPWIDDVAALGMSGVNLPFSEVYEGVQRGLVECVLSFPTVFLQSGLLDVADALMLIDSGPSTASLYAFNKDSWDALPLIVRQIMWDAIPLAYTEAMKNKLETYREFIELAEERGAEILYPTELNEALAEHRAGLRDGLASSAPAGVSDASGYLSATESAIAEAEDFVVGELGSPTTGASSREQVLSAFREGAAGIDWERYRAHVADLLAPHRPE